MGKSLEEALAAVHVLDERPSLTHPGRGRACCFHHGRMGESGSRKGMQAAPIGADATPFIGNVRGNASGEDSDVASENHELDILT
jgi:hypothetical protein